MRNNQPFSVCGARKGFADERGDLFFELARILESKRPRYFLLENVPGLMGIDSGRTFAKIIETLCKLGYCVEWRVYNSADYLPQVRKRVYIAGCFGINCSGKILAVRRSSCQNSRKNEQLIGGSQGSRVYSTSGTAVTQCSGSGGRGGRTGMYLVDYNENPKITETARCITTRQNSGMSHHKGEHSAVFVDMNENPKITDNAHCLNTRMDLSITNGTHKGERSGVLEEAPRAIINPFKKTTRQNGRRIKNPNEPMFTITVTDRHGVVHRGRIPDTPINYPIMQGNDNDFYLHHAYDGSYLKAGSVLLKI